MGIFTPKWKNKHSTKEDAVNAVYRIKDQDTLKKAALSASWRQAKIAAIGLISDENFLYDIAKNAQENIDIRKAAVSNISSQELLLNLSCLSKDDAHAVTLAEAAIEKITDPNLLKRALGSTYTYVRHHALSKLDDQDLFAKHAMSDPDPSVRFAAFKHVGDPNTKKSVILNESADSVLRNMLFNFRPEIAEDQLFCKKLYDKLSYAETSFTESLPLVIGCLKDEEILSSIAFNGKTYADRHAAARSIENEEIIAQLIMKAEIEMAVKQDLYFSMKRRELVEESIRKDIEYRDYRFWSEQDKKFADKMSADSY